MYKQFSCYLQKVEMQKHIILVLRFCMSYEKEMPCLMLFWILLRFAVLRDPAGWLSVNPVKGTVNTTGTLDRESPHVHNNRYSAVFMATDNGKCVISTLYSRRLNNIPLLAS